MAERSKNIKVAGVAIAVSTERELDEGQFNALADEIERAAAAWLEAHAPSR